MAKTLTIRLNDEESEELNRLLAGSPDCKTASKFMIYCMRWFPIGRNQLEEQSLELENLRIENERLQQVIENARVAAHALWDKVAQEDLLDK